MEGQRSEVRRLSIDEDMTIYNAEPLKAELLSSLEACQSLELDLTKVGAIDSAGLQLLALLKRESTRQGKGLSLVRLGAAAGDAIGCFDMAGLFANPATTAGERV